MSDCHHKKRLIYIGSNDMTLLREVDALPDNVVAAVFNLSNEGYSLLTSSGGGRRKHHTIAYGYRVCASDTSQTEISLDLRINQLAIVRQDGVPAACVLDDESFQLSTVN